MEGVGRSRARMVSTAVIFSIQRVQHTFARQLNSGYRVNANIRKDNSTESQQRYVGDFHRQLIIS